MITITHEDPNLILAAVLGEFTLPDFMELEKATEYTFQFQGKANLLMDLRDMLGATIDVAWEEIRFTRQHAQDFGRIAIVASDQWLQWSGWIARIFTEAEVQVFDDYDAAQAWIRG
jgi:hypothetical protein